MSRTIKAIERHMILPVRLGPRSRIPPVRSQTRLATASLSIGKRGEIGLQSRASSLVAEWQRRGLETLSGHAFRKLRLVFAPPYSVTTAGAAG